MFLLSRGHTFCALRVRLAHMLQHEGFFAMGGFSIWHWLIVGAVVMLVFGGKGKISDIMGDVAKGIKSFKKGLAEDDDKPEAQRPVESAGARHRPSDGRRSGQGFRYAQGRLRRREASGGTASGRDRPADSSRRA